MHNHGHLGPGNESGICDREGEGRVQDFAFIRSSASCVESEFCVNLFRGLGKSEVDVIKGWTIGVTAQLFIANFPSCGGKKWAQLTSRGLDLIYLSVSYFIILSKYANFLLFTLYGA